MTRCMYYLFVYSQHICYLQTITFIFNVYADRQWIYCFQTNSCIFTCMLTVNESVVYKRIVVFITCMSTANELVVYRHLAVFITCTVYVYSQWFAIDIRLASFITCALYVYSQWIGFLQATTWIKLWLRPTSPSYS